MKSARIIALELLEAKRDPARASKLLDYVGKRYGKRYDKKNVEVKPKRSVDNEEERNDLKLHRALLHDGDEPSVLHQFKHEFHNAKETHLPVKHLKLTQGRVYKDGVKKKVEEDDDRPIHVIHHEGHHYVIDGHHRYMKARLRGQTHIRAKVLHK